MSPNYSDFSCPIFWYCLSGLCSAAIWTHSGAPATDSPTHRHFATALLWRCQPSQNEHPHFMGTVSRPIATALPSTGASIGRPLDVLQLDSDCSSVEVLTARSAPPLLQPLEADSK